MKGILGGWWYVLYLNSFYELQDKRGKISVFIG